VNTAVFTAREISAVPLYEAQRAQSVRAAAVGRSRQVSLALSTKFSWAEMAKPSALAKGRYVPAAAIAVSAAYCVRKHVTPTHRNSS
jgi:hypothetical protein